MRIQGLLLFSVLFTTRVFAWGELGHEVIGYISEKNLTPEGQGFIYKIMGGEPMALTSTWPDLVRDDKRYKQFSSYHFFTIPDGLTYETIPSDRFEEKSADVMIKDAPSLITKRGLFNRRSLPEKQLLMRYFVHTLGDIHQPLHVGNGLDLGANACEVRLPDTNGRPQKTNLHSAWDSGIIEHIKKEILTNAAAEGRRIRYLNYPDFADAIIAEAKKDGTYEELVKLSEKGSRTDWYHESKALHKEVYPDASPDLTPQTRPYCKILNLETDKLETGAYDPAKVPELSQEYIKRSMVIIKRQLILGGLRLARELNTMAKIRGDKAWTPEKEDEFFRKVTPTYKEIRKPSSVKKTSQHDWCNDLHED